MNVIFIITYSRLKSNQYIQFTECLHFAVFLKNTLLQRSYFFVTESQKSAYLCSQGFSAILNTTGKPDSPKEVQAMSEILNRVAAFGAENSACGTAIRDCWVVSIPLTASIRSRKFPTEFSSQDFSAIPRHSRPLMRYLLF